MAHPASVLGSQHLQALEKHNCHKDNTFVKHASEHHWGGGDVGKYKVDIVGQFKKHVDKCAKEPMYTLNPHKLL